LRIFSLRKKDFNIDHIISIGFKSGLLDGRYSGIILFCRRSSITTLKTDYITSGTTLPPYLAFPRFLLGVDIRFTAKEVYAIMLDMALKAAPVTRDRDYSVKDGDTV